MTAIVADGQAIQESGAVGLAAHRVVAGAVASCRRTSVILGTTELATALTIFAPSLMMPPRSARRADHEAGDVLQEEERDPLLVAELDEAGALVRRIGVDHAADLELLVLGAESGLVDHDRALVGDDADGAPGDPAGAADQGLAIVRLELVELRVVEQARE